MIGNLLCLFGVFCGDRKSKAGNDIYAQPYRYQMNMPAPAPPRVGYSSGQLNSAEVHGRNFDKVAVIPDIHGDLEGFIGSLFLIYVQAGGGIGNVDEFGNRILAFILPQSPHPAVPLDTKARVLLVSLGDLMDRGPYTVECVELALQIETIFSGWKMIGILGNHEFMNHSSAFHYVNPQDQLQGVTRSLQFSSYGQLWKRLIGKFSLISKVYASRSIMFVHAGIDLNWFIKHIQEINGAMMQNKNQSIIKAVNDLIRTKAMAIDSRTCSALEENDSPIWTRDFERMDETILCKDVLPAILSAFDVGFIIVGHNPQVSRRVRVRCGGALIIADSAISAYIFKSPSSNPTAVIINMEHGGEVNSIQAHYSNEVDTIWRPTSP